LPPAWALPHATCRRPRPPSSGTDDHQCGRPGGRREVAADIVDRDRKHVEILPRFGEHDPLMEALMRGIIDALREEDQSARPYVDHLTRALAARLIRQHSTATIGAHLAAARIAKAYLNNAIEFIEANLDQSIGLPAIAEATGLSVSHFARQFRAAVGEAPHQYLLRRRVANAKQRLASFCRETPAFMFGRASSSIKPGQTGSDNWRARRVF
jgi:AraC-like DNA-binding protein